MTSSLVSDSIRFKWLVRVWVTQYMSNGQLSCEWHRTVSNDQLPCEWLSVKSPALLSFAQYSVKLPALMTVRKWTTTFRKRQEISWLSDISQEIGTEELLKDTHTHTHTHTHTLISLQCRFRILTLYITVPSYVCVCACVCMYVCMYVSYAQTQKRPQFHIKQSHLQNVSIFPRSTNRLPL